MSQILRNNLTRIISSSEINKRVFDIANDINREYCSKSPLFIGVLNGSFIFLADLVRCLNIDVEISFIKANSVAIAAFLLKPNKAKLNFEIDWVGFEIPDEFVVGYGLDYNQKFRNLKGIYQGIEI